MLRAIGVATENDLRELGAAKAYRRLKCTHGGRVSLNALYAMEAALQDRDWRALTREEKAALQRAVDQ